MSSDALKINTVGIASESLRRILANKKFIVKEEDNNETPTTIVDQEPPKIDTQIIAPDNSNIIIVDNIVAREDKMMQTDNIIIAREDKMVQTDNTEDEDEENQQLIKEIINYTFDDGCACKVCFFKRKMAIYDLANGKAINYRIGHDNDNNANANAHVTNVSSRKNIISATVGDKTDDVRERIRVKMSQMQKNELGVSLFKFNR
jgi:hypothetical protein